MGPEARNIATNRNWKRGAMVSPIEPPEGIWHLGFSSVKLISNF
jgi:hypothetical protein